MVRIRKARKRKPFVRDEWIEKYMKRALNQMWQWWPLRKEFKNARFKDSGLGQCDDCKNWFEREDTEVDHINPAVPVDQILTSWDEKINRKLCETSNMSLLCKPCHKRKSKNENAARRSFKKGEGK